MPDYIGNIPIPEIPVNGVFPLVPDQGWGYAQKPEVAIHRFSSGNTKIEQRFLLGTGAKRFQIRRQAMFLSDKNALKNFWETHYGPYGAFYYNSPNDDGNGTTRYTCRFANEPLTWEMVSNAVASVGVTLIEIPAISPVYTLNDTQLRFPSAALQTALLSQVQQLIPLIKIQSLETGYPAIFLSDRRCTVGGQLYVPRLLEFDGIGQSLGGESDEASFKFGNADRVMRDLVNDVDLYRAQLEFSLYHVGTGIKLDFWKGDILNWSLNEGPEFSVICADGLYELNMPYPCRRISRLCWKDYNDGQGCPYATQGALDLIHFPNASAGSCDRGYETANGCLAHSMKRYYGGVIAEPQGVRIRDNSTGTWGYGRSMITSVSLVSESIYDEVVPEIYTDVPMPVNCKIAAGRDESDFYIALGIVGEGPVVFDSGHMLDGQPNHGPGAMGLRTVPGNDPAGASDLFSLGQVGNQTGGDWRKVYVGGNTYKDNFAAGLAFLEIRRSDAKGLQLSRPGDHEMRAWISQGLQGWVWSATGVRSLQTLTNPFWIAVNAMLRAKGLRYASASECEKHFDVDAAIAAANIASASVEKLVGGPGLEQQFIFRGAMQEQKPLRDWLAEVLMNALGYYTFAFGKMKLGIRSNSSVAETFTQGNILFGSLQLNPVRPEYNHVTANFADQEFEFANNAITVQDENHAKLIGNNVAPVWTKGTLNLSGSPSKSQAGRIAAVRLREELGGINTAEWKAARQIAFKTTVLALNTEPGMVCSLTHPDMPGGAGEFRVTGWRLNGDFSVDIVGRTTTDSMYELVSGPKPTDVTADPVPAEAVNDYAVPPAPVMTFAEGNVPGDGTIVLPKITFGSPDNLYGITSVMVVVYFVDELNPKNSTLALAVADGVTTSITVVDGTKFTVGEPAAISNKSDGANQPEVVLVNAINGNVLTVIRAWHGTTPGAHGANVRIDALAGKIVHYPFKPGFFINDTAAGDRWTERIILPAARVTSIHAAATNAFGEGDLAIFNLLGFDSDPGQLNTQNGLRTGHGGALVITQDGTLSLGNYAGPPIIAPETRARRTLYASVRTAPTGTGNLEIDMKINGQLAYVLYIAVGQTISQYVAGGGLSTAIVNEGDVISYELKQYGGVLATAGSDLAITFKW